MVLSIALGIVLAIGVIYGLCFLCGIYLGHKAQKKEEKRISRNAEIDGLKENGELDIKKEKRFSERLREENKKKSE